MSDIYAGGLFNIAVTDGRNSEEGVFPIQRDILVPVLRTKPHLESDSEEWVPSDYRILKATVEFRDEILHSELLSRGWVYQEVRLTPANLFCSRTKMWWSCSELICAQIRPEGRCPVSSDGSSLSAPSLRGVGRSNAVVSWMQMVELYSATSTTVPGDRLVALVGFVHLFRSLYPDDFGNSHYHSGMWSFQILLQLLWVHHWKVAPLPTSRYVAAHPIPSWSWASHDGPLHIGMLSEKGPVPIEVVSVGRAGDQAGQLDRFGRATHQDQCVLHLRGVLVEVDILQLAGTDRACAGLACPSGHRDVVFKVHWDNADELQRASREAYRAWALLLNQGTMSGIVEGLVLRPSRGGLPDTPGGDGDVATTYWVRCGFFVARDCVTGGQRLEAFQITNDGAPMREVEDILIM